MIDPNEQALYERIVRDAMAKFGYGRTKAEALAKKMIVRFRKLGHFQQPGSPNVVRKVTGKKKRARNANEPRGPLTREEIAKLPPLVPSRHALRRAMPRNAWSVPWDQMRASAGDGAAALLSRAVAPG